MAVSRVSKGSKSSMSSAGTTGIATVLDMTAVRAVQSVVGCIVYASDLPDSLRELMHAGVKAVTLQAAANTVRGTMCVCLCARAVCCLHRTASLSSPALLEVVYGGVYWCVTAASVYHYVWCRLWTTC